MARQSAATRATAAFKRHANSCLVVLKGRVCGIGQQTHSRLEGMMMLGDSVVLIRHRQGPPPKQTPAAIARLLYEVLVKLWGLAGVG